MYITIRDSILQVTYITVGTSLIFPVALFVRGVTLPDGLEISTYLWQKDESKLMEMQVVPFHFGNLLYFTSLLPYI
jgi:hypothetical protein